MEPSPIARLSSAALGLGGVAGAGFVIVSQGETFGALTMLSPRWMIAHNLHFVSAALLLFGLVGLYQQHSGRLQIGGHFAFVLALLGTAFFFATGVITAAMLPFIAGKAPDVVSANGPLFHPVLPVIIIAAAVFIVGWFALGIVTARTGLFPAWTGWMIAIGAVVQGIPPQPFGKAPWIVQDIGWVIMAIGLVGMAMFGWRAATPVVGLAEGRV